MGFFIENVTEQMSIMLDEGATYPTRAHEADAGYDLYSPVDRELPPKGYTTIDTGVHFQIPQGYVGFLKSKSGLNVRFCIVSEGVIDSGYTGSVVVKLYNHSTSKSYHINKGDKISQIVFLPVYTPELTVVDALEETERGNNGFGSSGK